MSRRTYHGPDLTQPAGRQGLSQRLKGEEAPVLVGRVRKAEGVEEFKARLLSDGVQEAAETALRTEMRRAEEEPTRPAVAARRVVEAAAIAAAEGGEGG